MQKHKQTKATKKTAGKARKATKTVRTSTKRPARTKAPTAAKPTTAAKEPRPPRERDPRLPAAGTVLVRPYKGKDYRVTVLEDGFRYEGTEYRSLSKLASVISGQPSVNGFLWFRLTQPGQEAPRPRKRRSDAAVANSTTPAHETSDTP